MNEEEKKAIEELKEFIQGPCEICKYCSGAYRLNRKNIKQLLNLTEKLQKENEELEDDNKYLRERELYLEKRREDIINLFQNQQTATTIPKQKIKDKIEELNNISNAEKLEDIMIGGNYTITELVQYVLKELLDGSDTESED